MAQRVHDTHPRYPHYRKRTRPQIIKKQDFLVKGKSIEVHENPLGEIRLQPYADDVMHAICEVEQYSDDELEHLRESLLVAGRIGSTMFIAFVQKKRLEDHASKARVTTD